MRRLLRTRFETNMKKRVKKLRKDRKKNRRTRIIEYRRKITEIGRLKQRNLEWLKQKDEKYIENCRSTTGNKVRGAREKGS